MMIMVKNCQNKIFCTRGGVYEKNNFIDMLDFNGM